MNRISKLVSALGIAGLLLGGTAPVFSQQGPPQGGGQGGGGQGGGGRGNFDPAQMQQRMMERYREALEITNNDEWKAVEPLVTKINDARRDVGFGGMGRGAFRRPGGNDAAGAAGGGGQGGGRRGGADANPEMDALQKALESKAAANDIKAALGKVRDSRKAKEAKLASAQDELRKVLSVRQEAQAVLVGLLN